jgi:hypothetical protein
MFFTPWRPIGREAAELALCFVTDLCSSRQPGVQGRGQKFVVAFAAPLLAELQNWQKLGLYNA